MTTSVACYRVGVQEPRPLCSNVTAVLLGQASLAGLNIENLKLNWNRTHTRSCASIVKAPLQSPSQWDTPKQRARPMRPRWRAGRM